MILEDLKPIKECKNKYSYGEICVRCNQCFRFGSEDKQNNPTISDVIRGLEEVKELYGDKEVYGLNIIKIGNDKNLFIQFKDFTSHTIEIKTED